MIIKFTSSTYPFGVTVEFRSLLIPNKHTEYARLDELSYMGEPVFRMIPETMTEALTCIITVKNDADAKADSIYVAKGSTVRSPHDQPNLPMGRMIAFYSALDNFSVLNGEIRAQNLMEDFHAELRANAGYARMAKYIVRKNATDTIIPSGFEPKPKNVEKCIERSAKRALKRKRRKELKTKETDNDAE